MHNFQCSKYSLSKGLNEKLILSHRKIPSFSNNKTMIKKNLCLHLEGAYAVLEATVYVKELR